MFVLLIEWINRIFHSVSQVVPKLVTRNLFHIEQDFMINNVMLTRFNYNDKDLVLEVVQLFTV